MIQSFADRETEAFYQTGKTTVGYQTVAKIAMRKLDILDAAKVLDDVRVPPGNKLEKLRGKRSGQYSIRINEQWRICFRWTDTGPSDVEIVDYH
jgi:proteic killer suppression protein